MATRLDKLYARRSDPDTPVLKTFSEALRSIAQSDSVKYAIGAMQPIEYEYTKNTFAQAERVWKQLRDRMSISCEFDYQGSVTNDTHIRARSDIDVLAIIDRFFHA